PKIKIKSPIAQKQQLYQAIVALFTVALGIVLTLSAQFVSQEFGLPQQDPVTDPILGLGTSHFENLVADTFTGAVTGAVAGNVTGNVTAVVNTENIGLPSVITAPITWTIAAGGTGTVATITDGEVWLVHSVFVQTTTNFDCTGDDVTLTIGDGGDADGFIAAVDASLQATFTEATGYTAGFYGIEAGSGGAYTLDDGGPFVYAPSGGDETIDWVLDETSGETITAGAATIYVVYTRIE
ncbi:MAG: hypothetical protein MUQ65_12105, partial [Armatimonadetes bacterium]|nr:hypothetical protein [Armatimonadota bacterium]